MSITSTTTRRRETTVPTTLRTEPTALRVDTALPTSLTLEFALLDLDSVAPTPSATATNVSIHPNTTSRVGGSVETCSADNDCSIGKTCTGGKCVGVHDAAPLGGSGTEPTSHLNTASAIGIGVGVVALIALLIGIGFWFWRIRGRRQPDKSIESPSSNRDKSPPKATRWTVDNDQKTLVASLPNSPYNAGFHQQQKMTPEGFAKALDHMGEARSISTEKALPRPPPTENPLPSAPSISANLQRPASSKWSSEYELERFSNLRNSSTPQDPRVTTISELERKSALLSLPDLPPPSPSPSSRSYGWYQDIIGEQQNAEPPRSILPNGNSARIPTQAKFSVSSSLSPKILEGDPTLVPEPLSPAVPPSLATLRPKPVTAIPSSPTNTNLRLSPTTYQMSSQSPVPPNLPAPPPPPKTTSVSMLSTMTPINYSPLS
ncbi:uncharacterized protein K460DRAFT_31496 [Cucurbitaria berberidis CBS 394.84]|uniref:Uncharacterized protein n=1 Tax=Cucurbitaria berberidis CBS 394.84 TaxID=1168544 RepID=A0A9P4GTY9_9PLEO|nr:uncharacterized protein K460DRAFT_31496 [Cucurbitaria berberidis CBS 394.84]KAF1851320.1 hypothetical protein K460DRAFT_31496 [Cucurbitaria berberidis CBS 394.84]